MRLIGRSCSPWDGPVLVASFRKPAETVSPRPGPDVRGSPADEPTRILAPDIDPDGSILHDFLASMREVYYIGCQSMMLHPGPRMLIYNLKKIGHRILGP